VGAKNAGIVPEPEDIDKIASQQAVIVSQELLVAARSGGTEADFRREAALILDRAGCAAGLTIVPRDEFEVACGRVDSLYNRLILEYKKPGILAANNTNRANVAVIKQVKDYILDVAKRERREAHRLAGVATDGFFYVFVRQVGEGWSVDDPVPVNPASTEIFLRLLFSLCSGEHWCQRILLKISAPGRYALSVPYVLCTKRYSRAQTHLSTSCSSNGSSSIARLPTTRVGRRKLSARRSSVALFVPWASTRRRLMRRRSFTLFTRTMPS